MKRYIWNERKRSIFSDEEVIRNDDNLMDNWLKQYQSNANGNFKSNIFKLNKSMWLNKWRTTREYLIVIVDL